MEWFEKLGYRRVGSKPETDEGKSESDLSDLFPCPFCGEGFGQKGEDNIRTLRHTDSCWLGWKEAMKHATRETHISVLNQAEIKAWNRRAG